jgi:hypothetical protein
MAGRRKAPIDVDEALRNVVLILQGAPQNYRCFGVWWWSVKTFLRDAGYGPDQLYMLGSYEDPATAAMAPKQTLQNTLRAAFKEYAFNATYPHMNNLVESPDGELVAIYDADAGL